MVGWRIQHNCLPKLPPISATLLPSSNLAPRVSKAIYSNTECFKFSKIFKALGDRIPNHQFSIENASGHLHCRVDDWYQLLAIESGHFVWVSEEGECYNKRDRYLVKRRTLSPSLCTCILSPSNLVSITNSFPSIILTTCSGKCLDPNMGFIGLNNVAF